MKNRIPLYLVLLALPFLVWNCRKQLEPTEMDMTEYGWVLYVEEQFQEANDWFLEAVLEDTAYKDGYNGLGWSFGKLGEIDSSITKFQNSRTLALRDTTDEDLILLLADPPHELVKETTAGLALSYHAKGNHVNAVVYGNDLLSRTGDTTYTASQGSPRWSFSRDVTVSAKHIIWTLASSQFSLGDFEQSLVHVQQLLTNPSSFTPDVTTIDGRRELAEKIELLRDTF
ncbi:MAG: hypothetical protein V3U24_02875 [Candidatus Neomarinimicrobiota bacterium]